DRARPAHAAVRRHRRRLAAAGRDRLPARHCHRDGGLSRRPARQAAAGGRPRRGRQDRAGARRGAGHWIRSGPAAVLRGRRRGSRPVEWNHAKQILRIQAGSGDWEATKTDVFSEEFLLQRPLLTAIRRTEPTVLLIDETDKADIEIEGLLLEVLSDFAVTVPELGTLTATRAPFVLLTSNATRELSEALKRRCLYLHIDFPTPELERRILLSRVPELPEHFAEELVRIIGVLRGMQLKKVPSIAETIDWGRTVLALGLDTIDDAVVAATLGVVLKHQSDQQRATGELRLN
ncbi:LOW QUALITY PROTEIN: conserved hypothetical protein, partial [Mycobacterium tuberculosis T46]